MLSCKNPTIAIIDSGIGGVSILRKIINKFQSGNFIYYADNFYMPYGNKPRSKLKKRLEQIINTLNEKYNVDYIIIACNTASTVIDKKNFKNLYTMTFQNDHTYIATNLTKKNLTSMSVIGCKSLAKQIEKNIFNDSKMDRIVKKTVAKYKLNELSTFVLGCTHYELVKPLFEKYCPNTKIINNSSNLIKTLNFNMVNSELNVVVLLSKQSRYFENKILKLIEK